MGHQAGCFFNGGLRKDARTLYLQIRDGDETRVRLEEMNSLEEKQDLLSRAGLILQATGFAANLPPIERNSRAVSVGRPTQDGELHDLDSGEIIRGLFGMGLGGGAVLVPLLIGECFGLRTFGKVLGLVMISATLGAATGPVLTGWIFDVMGSYRLAFMLHIASFTAAAVAIYSLRRPEAASP